MFYEKVRRQFDDVYLSALHMGGVYIFWCVKWTEEFFENRFSYESIKTIYFYHVFLVDTKVNRDVHNSNDHVNLKFN